MKHSKSVVVLFSLFFLQVSFTSAITKCTNQPITLNWVSSNISGCTLTPSTNNIACSFSPIPNTTSNKPITLTSGSCTNTLACGATSVTDTVTIDTTKVWNGSACVSISGTITSNFPTCTIPAGQSTCTVRLTWNTINPFGTSAVTRNNPAGTVFTANSGGPSDVTVSGAYANVTYYLYNNAIELDSVPITPSCVAGASWRISSGTCEYNATATLTASPIKVSYNSTSTLTWGSTNATNCSIAGGVAWPYPGTLNGNVSTNPITSSSTFKLQCFGGGNPSPIRTAFVDVCPSATPIYNNSVCQGLGSVTTTLGDCNYTSSCPININSDNNDTCALYKDGVFYQNITLPTNDPKVIVLNQSGTYQTRCTVLSDDGKTYTSWSPNIPFSTLPPKPIVSLRASPSNISVNGQTVLTWKVSYPNSVQNPVQPACTLTAKPVCPQGVCNTSQLLASTTINNIIKNDNTDANDPNGSRKITTSAINEVVPPLSEDWQAKGKKTFNLNHSMDFMLRCGNGVNESQGARVLVTSSTEG